MFGVGQGGLDRLFPWPGAQYRPIPGQKIPGSGSSSIPAGGRRVTDVTGKIAVQRLNSVNQNELNDKTLAEWDTETSNPERLAEIQIEFSQKVAEGWFAADISDKRNALIDEFDPNSEILLIPRVQGGF